MLADYLEEMISAAAYSPADDTLGSALEEKTAEMAYFNLFFCQYCGRLAQDGSCMYERAYAYLSSSL